MEASELHSQFTQAVDANGFKAALSRKPIKVVSPEGELLDIVAVGLRWHTEENCFLIDTEYADPDDPNDGAVTRK